MVQINEVVILIIILTGFIPIFISYFRDKQNNKWLFLAYFSLLVGAISTILEEYPGLSWLNYLEHGVGIVLAGLFFLVCSLYSYKRQSNISNQISKKLGSRK